VKKKISPLLQSGGTEKLKESLPWMSGGKRDGKGFIGLPRSHRRR